MGKKILQAISGILLAGLTAIAMGTWGLPEENDLLVEAIRDYQEGRL